MIVETFEVEIGDVGDLAGKLPPVGELRFSGDAEAQCVPGIDFLDAHDIRRGRRFIGRLAAAGRIGESERN